MLASPFSFYRGGALVMAADLARTPNSRLQVQLCGDAHISNFGSYASPERRIVFDINDFDKTHPGPFEWDVKRLAASLTVAGRDNGFSAKKRRMILLATAAAYRTSMVKFAGQGNLPVWYAQLDMREVLSQIGDQLDTRRKARTEAALDKAQTRDGIQALAKLTTMVDGRARIKSPAPAAGSMEELLGQEGALVAYEQLGGLHEAYRRTLQSDRRHLLEQFTLVQVARKVVGVGSGRYPLMDPAS
jgi:uncharacterized protein (DUF2252 family)